MRCSSYASQTLRRSPVQPGCVPQQASGGFGAALFAQHSSSRTGSGATGSSGPAAQVALVPLPGPISREADECLACFGALSSLIGHDDGDVGSTTAPTLEVSEINMVM